MEQYPFTLPHLKTPLDVDERRREMGDVAEGFMLHLVADTEGAAEKVGLVDTAFVLSSSCGYMYSTRSRWHAITYNTY